MMKPETKELLKRNDYVTKKSGLFCYLADNNKLPFVSPLWSETYMYYMKCTIEYLETFI